MKNRLYELLLGHAVFAALLLLAWTFAYERMLYMDSAYYLFKFIQDGNLIYDEGQRYTGILARILPWIALGNGASLSVVLVSYSLNFILLYYVIWFIATRFTTPDRLHLALAVPLLLLVGLREGFYHPVAEPQIGMVFCGLLFTWMVGAPERFPKLSRIGWLVISLVIVALCFFCHPVTVFVAVFIIAFSQEVKGKLLHWETGALLAVTVSLYLLKMAMTPADSYEGDQFAQLKTAFSTLGGIADVYSFRFFIRTAFLLHLPGLAVLVWLTVHYSRQRNWNRLGVLLGSTLTFLVVTIVVYHRGDSDIMMEKNFMPLSAFPLLALLYEMRSMPQRRLIMTGLAVLLGWCLVGVAFRSGSYTNRLNTLTEMLQDCKEQNVNKAVIITEGRIGERLMVPWALSVETLMLSSLNSPNNSRTLYAQTTGEEARRLANETRPDQLLFTNFWLHYDPKSLNGRYFNLRNAPYAVLDYSKQDKEPLIYFPQKESAPTAPETQGESMK